MKPTSHHITLQLPWVTKTRLFLVVSIKYQAHKKWKNINKGIISLFNTKFSELKFTRIVWQTVRRITDEILKVKELKKFVFMWHVGYFIYSFQHNMFTSFQTRKSDHRMIWPFQRLHICVICHMQLRTKEYARTN